jgi:hypothetical protein
MTPEPPTPDPTPPAAAACAAFEAVVQRVLDWELGPETLDGPHPNGCPDCRGLAGAVRLLLSAPVPLPSAPVGLTDRVLAAVQDDRRVQVRVKWAWRTAGLALAASVLLAGYLGFSSEPPADRPDVAQNDPPKNPVPSPEPPPRVSDQVADAGAALAAITRRARDQTVTPTRNLIPPPDAVELPMADVPGVEPAAESLAGVPQAAQSGVEPVARTTRRAINLFLRDTGLAPAKPDL